MELSLNKIDKPVFFVLDGKVISARITKFNMFENETIQNAVVSWATESYPSGIVCQAHDLFEKEIDAYKRFLENVEYSLMEVAEKVADIVAQRKELQKTMSKIRANMY